MIVVEFAGIVTVVLLAVFCLYRLVTAQERAGRKMERLELVRVGASSSNHQEMFLLINKLVSDHDRGFTVAFLEQEDLTLARKLQADYRKEISTL